MTDTTTDDEKLTTIQVSISLRNRLSELTRIESERMGLSKPMGVRAYLEIIAKREEDINAELAAE